MHYTMAPMAIATDRSERAAFIRRTYAHLAGAILAFTLIEVAIFKLLGDGLNNVMMAYFRSPVLWLVVFGGFMVTSYVARYWAMSGSSQTMQYLGLSLYVVAFSVLALPTLFIASLYSSDGAIFMKAGILTLSLFAGLTATVFVTGKDFSFLRAILMIGSFLMLGVIICAIVMAMAGVGGMSSLFGLGIAVFGVVLMAGFILYDTSNIMLHFRTDQHVSAALELFASVALMFLYILQILMYSGRNN